MRLAQIRNNKVVNITIVDSSYQAQINEVILADTSPVGIDWSYDGSTFTAPVVVPVVDNRPKHITLGALQKRLGVMNVFAIDTSTHPICVALRSYLNRLTFIDLDDPDLPSLLGLMVSANQPAANATFPGSGPITTELVSQIINTPIDDKERP